MVASDSSFLAAERTYLAWVRTALALLGFGLVLSRFFVTALGGARMSFFVAAISIAFASICLVFATARYYWIVDEMKRDSFSPDMVGPGFNTAFTLIMIAIGSVIVWKLRSSNFETRRKGMVGRDHTYEGEDTDLIHSAATDHRTTPLISKAAAKAELRQKLVAPVVPSSDIGTLVARIDQLVTLLAEQQQTRNYAGYI